MRTATTSHAYLLLQSYCREKVGCHLARYLLTGPTTEISTVEIIDCKLFRSNPFIINVPTLGQQVIAPRPDQIGSHKTSAMQNKRTIDVITVVITNVTKRCYNVSRNCVVATKLASWPDTTRTGIEVTNNIATLASRWRSPLPSGSRRRGRRTRHHRAIFQLKCKLK